MISEIKKIWKKKYKRKTKFHKKYTKLVLKRKFFIQNPNTNTDVLLFSGRILSKYDGIIKANGLYNVKLGELVYVRKNVNNKIRPVITLTTNKIPT